MPHAATIMSVPSAVKVIKRMQLRGVEWGDYREGGRAAIAQVLQEQMKDRIDRYLEELGQRGDVSDRRNGSYTRHLLTELGDIELSVPRTRTFSALEVVRAYARRVKQVDRMILACFVLGLSTRKVAKALLPILGESVSASAVSRIAKTLDQSVEAFHRRPLKDRYRVLLLDGVVLSRKTGAGAVRRPVLVALGILPDGRKEVIDYALATSESAAAWEAFLNDLYRRGLKGEGLELIVVDGGPGLWAALPIVYSAVPRQRCWAHKIRNVLDKVHKADWLAVKRSLHTIMKAPNIIAARSAACRFAQRWSEPYAKAVSCLRNDLDDLLAFFRFNSSDWRKASRTTNAIERRFREVRRRTRPMGVFCDRTSMDRILFAVFTYENSTQGTGAPFLVTQNS